MILAVSLIVFREAKIKTLVELLYFNKYEFEKIHSINADEESLKFIVRYLTDIRDEVPDADGIREIVELWRESEC